MLVETRAFSIVFKSIEKYYQKQRYLLEKYQHLRDDSSGEKAHGSDSKQLNWFIPKNQRQQQLHSTQNYNVVHTYSDRLGVI
ncbi:hypothetical protein DPMN_137146 [Dreissena polymorpha]|uniref:Uncharacterized protein n=1 Tax=Dreissena polymorpha TaxID=45954 RepID=A0A9D4G793_DREPO|nr:hypothetical protein DPMN_137146 [Dreissena polymorpha]